MLTMRIEMSVFWKEMIKRGMLVEIGIHITQKSTIKLIVVLNEQN